MKNDVLSLICFTQINNFMKTIKELRRNFIERNQLNPDFFNINNVRDPEEDVFRDVNIFQEVHTSPSQTSPIRTVSRPYPHPGHRTAFSDHPVSLK